MLRLELPTTPLRLLCIGAHPDDIEIGAGGTILRLAAEGRIAEAHWFIPTGVPARAEEARRAAALFVGAGVALTVHQETFRDGFLPAEWARVKDAFEAVAREVDPQLILTHRGDDAHQDHRIVSELTWNTFRDHLILEYEIPKWDGDLGRPTVYVPLADGQMERKVELLMTAYPSQSARDWFRGDTFTALARLRGMECRSPSGYAEAFVGRKVAI
jgi:LmbE family N-acetylglucosaminyl deacetylase